MYEKAFALILTGVVALSLSSCDNNENSNSHQPSINIEDEESGDLCPWDLSGSFTDRYSIYDHKNGFGL